MCDEFWFCNDCVAVCGEFTVCGHSEMVCGEFTVSTVVNCGLVSVESNYTNFMSVCSVYNLKILESLSNQTPLLKYCLWADIYDLV